MKIIDLFCGAGGFSLGFKQESFTIVEAYDFWDDAICTYNHNFGGGGLKKDLTQYPLRLIPTSEMGIDGVIGSPPCVEFSTANANGNVLDGLLLIYRFLEVVCHVKPKFWIMENVPDVRAFLPRVMCSNMIMLNACDFEVSQKRKRTFFGNFPSPSLTHSEHSGQKSLFSSCFQSWKRIQDVLDLNKKREIGTPSERRFGDVVMTPNEASNTLTCISRYFLKLNETIYELDCDDLKRLQGFPEDYKFLGSESSVRRQIGNSVCPPVARAIAKAIKEKLT